MARFDPKPADAYHWCDPCRRSYGPDELDQAGHCPVCHGPLREMGKLNAILRGLVSNELAASDLFSRHRQLVRLIWTRNGMGERYYRALTPDMPYNRFEARVTELLCRGAQEGWVRFILPPAPTADDSAYRVEFESDERFVAELEALVAPKNAVESERP